MEVFIGFDDTDVKGADRGTGKLARWFEKELPVDSSLVGVVRQQLLVDKSIPYTSHNSSACLIIHAKSEMVINGFIEKAIAHLEKFSLKGSDPGVCVAYRNGDNRLERLMAFGRRCTSSVVSQREAMEAASGFHLSGHGGTNDGIIGAAAAVGLTSSGWNGRFIEYGRLREFPEIVKVSELERSGIRVLSIDRDAQIPGSNDYVRTKDWLRPRLVGGEAVLVVRPNNKKGTWESIGEKNHKK